MAKLKSLMVLWKEVANELATWCHTSTLLDYKKLEWRVKHEGTEFLTLSLPRFGKDFERSLDQGKVDRDYFQGFAFSSGLPRFLGGFLDRVFDRGTGLLLDDPCVDSILAIRQLTLMFAKILLPCSDARIEGAINKYIECEKDVDRADEEMSSELLKEFEGMSTLLWADVFSEVDRKVAYGELIPKHGPGSTADKLLGNQKYNQTVWTRRLESVFPFLDYALPSPSYYSELTDVTILEPDAEMPVKVITVPKTLKTPRIIAVEPTCMQFMQQAILEALVQELEAVHVRGNTRMNIAKGFVGFADQNPNREMARLGSRNQTLATLDMSEASDRVSNQHVLSLLRRWPHLSEAVQATRSRKADVPGHGVISLSKFASMGSAVCFPMEAMVFLTIIFLGIQKQLNTQLTRKEILSFRGKVRVYGDDIIIPIEYVDSVISLLETFGLKVNKDKSFWTGKFRESCGEDYYDGVRVTPVRVRNLFPRSRKDASKVISLVELRNQFYLAGYWSTAEALDRRLRNVLPYFPIVEPTSPALGRLSVSFPYQEERQHRTLHMPLVRAYRTSSKSPISLLDGHGALTKWFLKRGDEPFFDKDHLVRSGRPRSVGIKIGWMAPY